MKNKSSIFFASTIKKINSLKKKMLKPILSILIDHIGLLELNAIVIEYLTEKTEKLERDAYKTIKVSDQKLDRAAMLDSIAEDYSKLNRNIIEAGY